MQRCSRQNFGLQKWISQRKLPCACIRSMILSGLPAEGVLKQIVTSRRDVAEAYAHKLGWGFLMMDACWRKRWKIGSTLSHWCSSAHVMGSDPLGKLMVLGMVAPSLLQIGLELTCAIKPNDLAIPLILLVYFMMVFILTCRSQVFNKWGKHTNNKLLQWCRWHNFVLSA
jgi:hypothetical protein